MFHPPRLRNEKHHSEERVLRAGVADGPVAVHVSILTHCEKRGLLEHPVDPLLQVGSVFQSSPTPRSGCYFVQRSQGVHHVLVSILTHSEKWVLPGPPPGPGTGRRCFNPHPLREAGATIPPIIMVKTPNTFQSSPTPRSGCYHACRRGVASGQCFNPHPLREAGATCMKMSAKSRIASMFQSSPTPRSGCYLHEDVGKEPDSLDVSILTHSEKRVLRVGQLIGLPSGAPVSILTHSEKRVLPGRSADSARSSHCFNPHPLREAGATICPDPPTAVEQVSILTHSEKRVLLQGQSVAAAIIEGVSILTHSEKRVLLADGSILQTEQMFQSSPTPRSGCYARP